MKLPLKFSLAVLAVLLLAACAQGRDSATSALHRSLPNGPNGQIELSLIDRSNLQPANGDMFWTVMMHPSNGYGARVMYSGNSASPSLTLLHGWYTVEVRHDRGVNRHVFQIRPGVRKTLRLVRMDA